MYARGEFMAFRERGGKGCVCEALASVIRLEANPEYRVGHAALFKSKL